jgi:hypothetical protein
LSRILASLTALVTLAACAGEAHAQSQRVALPIQGTVGESIPISVRSVSPSVRPGGHGFVRVDLHNPGQQPRTVEVDVRETWSPTYSATDRTVLEPGQRAQLFLSVRFIEYQARIRARVDGGAWFSIVRTIESPEGVGLSVGVVASPGLDVPGLRAVLERLTASASNPGAAFGAPRAVEVFEELRPDELPPTWDGLSGFDLLIVDARRGGVDRATQSVLRDFLRAGGHVLVLGVEALDGGPLAEALSGRPLAVGFGSALGLTIAEAEGLPGNPDAVRRMTPWLLADTGPLMRGARPVSGPLPPEIFQPMAIPGVGDVPYRAYLAVLLLFGVLVGPVNYLALRRKRALGYMLLTVPALGLLTTVVLLAYGLFKDGLDLHSASRSLTILDQEAHDAVSWEGRTVFTGLSPSALRPRATTGFDVTSVLQSQGSERGIMLDFDEGIVGGAAVPPRSPVTFGLASLGPERARLRFERREAASGFEVLPSEGLRPVPGPRNLVLRTADGSYWVQAADGRMESATSEAATAIVSRLLAGFDGRAIPLDPTFGGASFPLGTTFGKGGAAEGMRRAAAAPAIPAGCYLAVVVRPDLLDDLGLVGEDVGYHLVLGRLGQEDIVD